MEITVKITGLDGLVEALQRLAPHGVCHCTAESKASVDAPAPAPEPTPEKEETLEVSEDFRIEVRRALATLNRTVGKNIASELIRSFGVEKLTEVALSDLPALMDKAKKVLNAE